jgi:hypothetical protein
VSAYTRLADAIAEFDALHPALAPDHDPHTDKVIDAARAFVAEAMLAAPQAEPRVERYGDGVLVHWPDGTTSQYLEAGDCVTGAPQPQAARCQKCKGTGDVCTGTIDGVPELFDCEQCGGTGKQAPQPSPQASAEDVELVGLAVKEHAARYPGSVTEAAFERIRASLGVGK